MISYYLNGFETLSTDVYENHQDLGLIGSTDSIRLYADILNNNAQNILDNCNSFENIQYCFELIKAFEKQYFLGSPSLFDIQLDASVGVGINDRFSRVYDRFQERSDLVNGAKYCIKNISTSSLGIYLQEEEAQNDGHMLETIGIIWIIEP